VKPRAHAFWSIQAFPLDRKWSTMVDAAKKRIDLHGCLQTMAYRRRSGAFRRRLLASSGRVRRIPEGMERVDRTGLDSAT